MNTHDHMTKLGSWPLTKLYTFDWPGHEYIWPYWTVNHWTNCQDEYPWPYDQIGLLTTDQAMMYTLDCPGHLNTLDHMTKLGCWPLTDSDYILDWPGHDGFPWSYDHIGLLTTDQTVMSTGLVMMSSYPWPYDHTGLLITRQTTMMHTSDWPGHDS